MYSIELMMREHDNILKLLGVMRSACCGVLEGQVVNDKDFRAMIAIARNYADKHHHGKEEQILFKEMTEKLGSVGTNLVQHGMLVEHNFGRLHITELENALNQYCESPKIVYKLNILTEATGYANLLQRHIEKENQVVYTYAKKNLPPDSLHFVNEQVVLFEDKAEKSNIQETYLPLLQRLVDQYGIL